MVDQLLPDYLDDDYCPTLVSGAVHRVVGNEGIIWSPIWPGPHFLDPVAQLLVSVFDGVATRRELAAELHEVLEVEVEVAEAQISRVLEGLGRNGLLPFTHPDVPVWNAPTSLLPEPNW